VVLRAGSEPGPYPTIEKARAAGASDADYRGFINNVAIPRVRPSRHRERELPIAA